MPASRTETHRIRSLRPPKPAVDPWRPIDQMLEIERQPVGTPAQVLTVFLAGSECPFTCVFCDLWRFTLDQPTPPGAIPAQIEHAIASVQGELTATTHIKLYNASNFFDPRAVPPQDDTEISKQLDRFAQVVVECHPRLVGQRCLDFADRIGGKLQVAMGLETIHPDAQPKLGKQATLDDFDAAATRLGRHGISWRAFVLVGAPFVPSHEAVYWAVRSVEYAFDRGAEHVTLIPVRGGNGEMERLAQQGLFNRPTLAQLEEALERSRDLGSGVVTVDTWDLEVLFDCLSCGPQRIRRLEHFNTSGTLTPRPVCTACVR